MNKHLTEIFILNLYLLHYVPCKMYRREGNCPGWQKGGMGIVRDSTTGHTRIADTFQALTLTKFVCARRTDKYTRSRPFSLRKNQSNCFQASVSLLKMQPM